MISIFLKWTVFSLLILSVLIIFMFGLRSESVAACNSCKFVLTIEGRGTITITNNNNKSTYSANGGRLTSVFAVGTKIKINAEAADDWNFAGWEGSISSSISSKENPLVLKVEEDMEIKAIFNKNE